MSTAAKFYLAFGLLTCGYFSFAAANNWPGPEFHSGTGGSSFGPGYYGHSYSTGRSSGGFGGGGK